MTYVIRDGKKRGRGRYLRLVSLFDGLVHYCQTRRQGLAKRFKSRAQAGRAFEVMAKLHQEIWLRKCDARIVKLKKNPQE